MLSWHARTPPCASRACVIPRFQGCLAPIGSLFRYLSFFILFVCFLPRSLLPLFLSFYSSLLRTPPYLSMHTRFRLPHTPALICPPPCHRRTFMTVRLRPRAVVLLSCLHQLFRSPRFPPLHFPVPASAAQSPFPPLPWHHTHPPRVRPPRPLALFPGSHESPRLSR